MKQSRETLLAESATTGFRPEIQEKVYQLLNLLEGIRSHPFLRGKLALKGGTALNLFLFDVPRLSVDIDLNYIGAAERKVMQQQRPKIEEAIRAVCSREEITVTRAPTEHAGGKWRLRYSSALGHDANLELDINFLLRVPLWTVTECDSQPIGSMTARRVPVLDTHELAAGKMVALFARRASRDLYDTHALLTHGGLDEKRLRAGFVVYGAMNRKDWRTISLDDVGFDGRELQNQLLPVLRQSEAPTGRDIDAWTCTLVDECREGLGAIWPISEPHREFIDRLLEYGEVRPELVASEPEQIDRIASHPGLLWKAKNVKAYRQR